MSNEHSKEFLNRNAWEQPEVEGVAQNDNTAKHGNNGVKRSSTKNSKKHL